MELTSMKKKEPSTIMKAQQQQPIKCEFPNIPYDPHFVPLNDQRIPQHTYTFLKNNGMGYGLLDGTNTTEALERKINDKITIYKDGDDNLLFEIFCLIQIWGGRMGRIAFLQDIPFPDYWNKYLKDCYRKLACTCNSIVKKDNNLMGVDLEDIEKVYQAIYYIRANPNIRKLNVSFLTKHTRFWLQKNNFDNPLPILIALCQLVCLGKAKTYRFYF